MLKHSLALGMWQGWVWTGYVAFHNATYPGVKTSKKEIASPLVWYGLHEEEARGLVHASSINIGRYTYIHPPRYWVLTFPMCDSQMYWRNRTTTSTISRFHSYVDMRRQIHLLAGSDSYGRHHSTVMCSHIQDILDRPFWSSTLHYFRPKTSV